MEIKPQSYSSGRSFGHSVITWEIENYGLALWQKYWEVETPLFSVRGPEFQKTKWKLILQTDSEGANVNERMSVKLDSETRSATILDSKKKENIQANSKQTVSTNVDSTQTESVEVDSERQSGSVDSEQKKLTKAEVKPKYLCDSLMLNLERAKVDKGPCTVWVNWKVYYVGVDGKKFSVAEEERFFVKGYKYGLHIGVIFDLEREFECNSGIVTFVCDMIVRDEYSHVNFDRDISIDLCGLSEDFQWIFEQQKFSDVEIKLDKKSIFAHKAMLSLRSEYFKNVFKEKDLDVVELPDESYDGIVKTLEYMYSGDLEDVVGKPSISTYDSITCLNLPELEAHYAPDARKIRTKIVVKRLTYMWSIKDFMTKEMNCLSSPIICKNLEDAAWQIHLYPRGVDGKSEFVSVSVEYIEGTVSDGLSIQCAVLEENETCHSWRTLQKSAKFHSRFEDEEFIDRKNLLKILKDDLLKLGFKVRMYTGKEHSRINNKASTPVLCTKKKSFETLSNYMSTLRQSEEHSDVILKVGEEVIKAHKFILSARSFMLSSMLEETEENYLILSVKPNVLEILLDYMYCAILDVTDIKTLLEVYAAAEEFLISRLREKCSKLLLNSLTLDTVCDVLDLADEYANELLKREAIMFMNLNESVFKQQAWQNLKAKKPKLCEEADIIKGVFNNGDAAVITLSGEYEKVVRFEDVKDEINDGIEKCSSRLSDKDTGIASLIVKREISETIENNGTEVSKQLHEAFVEIILGNQEKPKSDKIKMIAQMMHLNESDDTRSSQRQGNRAFQKESCVNVEVVPENMHDVGKIQSKPYEKGSELSNQPNVEMVKILPEQSGALEIDLTTHSNGTVVPEQQADNGFEAAAPISKECQRVLETENLEEDRGNGLEIVALIPEKEKVQAESEMAPVAGKVSEASETPGEPRGKRLGAEVSKELCAVELSSEAAEGDSCAKGLKTTSKTA